MSTLQQKQLKNAKRDLARFQIAARQTIGAERAKYQMGIRNLQSFIAVLSKP